MPTSDRKLKEIDARSEEIEGAITISSEAERSGIDKYQHSRAPSRNAGTNLSYILAVDSASTRPGRYKYEWLQQYARNKKRAGL